MSIEAAVRAMITAGSTVSLVPDARVTHGYRLQFDALPAITFEVTSVTADSISGPTYLAEVEIRCIAVTGADALAIVEQVRTASVAGSFAGHDLRAVIYTGHKLESPSSGEGDEAEPSEAVANLSIYYTE